MAEMAPALDYLIAPHLKASEVACRCGCGLAGMHIDALMGWSFVRRIVNAPIGVVSGLRCSEHNRAVGGAEDSRHLKGLAFDLDWRSLVRAGYHPLSVDFRDLMIMAGARGIGLGCKPHKVHVDWDPSRPELTLWRYP